MGILDSFEIATNGLNVHGERLKISATNIANIDTPNYIRKIPVLMAREDNSFAGMLNNMKENVFAIGTIPNVRGGVSMTGVVEDPMKGTLVYKPGHPDADANGYIRTSNVSPLVEMADAQMATRAYEANLAVISVTKTMAQRAAEIGK